MNASLQRSVYRIRKFSKTGDIPKGYRHSLEVSDDASKQVKVTCDLVGKAVNSSQVIHDDRGQSWLVSPNRKIMPSQWALTDQSGNMAMQFDQKLLGKLINPLYKVAMVLTDSEGRERYRLVDPRRNIPDHIFGVGPNEWALISGDTLVAKLRPLPAEKHLSAGFFAKLKNLLGPVDRGLESLGIIHALPPHVVLGMVMLFDELKDPSAG